MSAKVARMRGLERIRRLQEEMERRELQAAMGAVAEVQAAIEMDGASLLGARDAGRAALVRGDRGEWLLADAQGEVARANIEKLKVLRARREAAVPAAMAKFMACRLEHEQAKSLALEARAIELLDLARREQAAADEWTLTRRMIVKRD
jgi:hypothetical protein